MQTFSLNGVIGGGFKIASLKRWEKGDRVFFLMGTFCWTCQGFIGFVVLFQNYSSQIAGAKLNKSNVRRRKGGKKRTVWKKKQQHTHIKEHKGTRVAKAGKGPNKTSLCTEQTKSQTG